MAQSFHRGVGERPVFDTGSGKALCSTVEHAGMLDSSLGGAPPWSRKSGGDR